LKIKEDNRNTCNVEGTLRRYCLPTVVEELLPKQGKIGVSQIRLDRPVRVLTFQYRTSVHSNFKGEGLITLSFFYLQVTRQSCVFTRGGIGLSGIGYAFIAEA